MCRDVGGITDPLLFLQFLHNAGEVFWREGCFGDRVILDQAWVLDAVYAVFNREKCVRLLRAQAGRFTAGLLDAILWGPLGHSQAEQRLFLEFMVSSGICFAIDQQNEGAFVAPDFLPETDPNCALHRFDAEAERQLQFESLPPLLMRNMISRIGRGAGADAIYWRSGVLFYNTETRTRVMIEQQSGPGWNGQLRITGAGGDLSQVTRLGRRGDQRRGTTALVPSASEDIPKMEDATLTLGPDPARLASYYISYAWDEAGTPPDKSLTTIVDQLCEAAKTRGDPRSP